MHAPLYERDARQCCSALKRLPTAFVVPPNSGVHLRQALPIRHGARRIRAATDVPGWVTDPATGGSP